MSNEAKNVTALVFLVVLMAVGLVTCTGVAQQSADCRNRGGQPIIDKFYQVACVPKMQ